MTDEDRKAREARLDALRTLAPCRGIMQHPRHKLPVPIAVNPLALPTVTKEELRVLMKPFWDAHPPIPIVPEGLKQDDGIKPEHKRFLAMIEAKPLKPTTFYYRTLGLSLSTGDRVRKLLIEKGFVRVHTVRTYRRGGNPEVIELLPPAYDVIGMPSQKPSVKGGVIHRFWAHQIADQLRKQGLKPTFEFGLNGKAVDVAVTTDSGVVAYEVQMDVRADLVTAMLEKDFRAGFSRVIVGVPSVDDAKKVGMVINDLSTSIEGIKDKTEVRLLAEFYQSPKEESCS